MTKELIDLIDNLAESGRSIDRLARMPPGQLDALLDLLSDAAALDSLRKLLHTVKELQKTRGSSRGTVEPTRDSKSAPFSAEALVSIFDDTERFPTVLSISKFIRDVFAFEAPPPKSKMSRDRYIRQVITAIEMRPSALNNVRRLIESGKLNKNDRAFGTLYDFIRGRLTE